MKKRVPKWIFYEHHWQQHPPSEEELHKAKGILVDLLLTKGGIFQLIGKWDDCQNIGKGALRLAEEIEDKQRLAETNLALGSILL